MRYNTYTAGEPVVGGAYTFTVQAIPRQAVPLVTLRPNKIGPALGGLGAVAPTWSRSSQSPGVSSGPRCLCWGITASGVPGPVEVPGQWSPRGTVCPPGCGVSTPINPDPARLGAVDVGGIVGVGVGLLAIGGLTIMLLKKKRKRR